MERIQVAPNFYLDEFVDPYTYFNTEDHGLSLIDPRLFDLAQLLRYLYMKPITINNWWKYYQLKKDVWSIEHIIKKIEITEKYHGKNIYKWSGLRTNRTDIGSEKSAHRPLRDGQCKAIDPKGNELELFKIAKKHAEVFHKLGLRRLEDYTITPGWLHMDLLERNTKKKSIRVVNLTGCTQTIYF